MPRNGRVREEKNSSIESVILDLAKELVTVAQEVHHGPRHTVESFG